MSPKLIIASFATVSVLSLGCDISPIDSTGGNALPTSQSPVTSPVIDQNYSDPARNPGLSGASPQPQPTTGTVDPTDSTP